MTRIHRIGATLLGAMFVLSVGAGQAQLAKRRAWGQPDDSLASGVGSVFDDTVQKSELKVRRVAIIPNRMPLFLTEADMWRRFNWQVLAGMFEDRGFDVVDFDTTNEAFIRSNLPMEDTGVSEEKFSRMADSLQADILVMPYYGTSFQTKAVLVANVPKYIALVTLQIYSASENKFIYRSDQTSFTSVFMGYSMVALLVSLPLPATTGGTEPSGDVLSGTYDPGTPGTMNPAKILLPVLGVVADLAVAMIPPKRHWEKAFLKADRKALQPFFSSFKGPTGSATKKKAVKKAPAKAASTAASPAKKAAAGAEAPSGEEPKKEEEDLGLGVDE